MDELTELYIDDVLRSRERNLIQQGLGELLADYIREPEFPRATRGSLLSGIPATMGCSSRW